MAQEIVRVRIECSKKMSCPWFHECHRRPKSILIDGYGRVQKCSECVEEYEDERIEETEAPKRRIRAIPKIYMGRMSKLMSYNGALSIKKIASILKLEYSVANSFARFACNHGGLRKIGRGRYLINDVEGIE